MKNDFNTTLVQEASFILLKLADVLQKMRKIKDLSPYHQNKVATQAKYIYAPVAHRLGLGNIKAELDDLYLKFYAKPIYYSFNQLLGNTHEGRRQFINEFKEPIETALRQAGLNCTTSARVKSISSIIDKMRRLETNLEGIYDVFAIRIILNATLEEEEAMCWKAYELLTERYQVLSKKFRDWLTQPRPNGYQALHVTLMDKKLPWVEVQIRSKRMDAIAEKGSAAHWKYKEGNQHNPLEHLDSSLAEIRKFLEAHPHVVQEALAAVEGSREA